MTLVVITAEQPSKVGGIEPEDLLVSIDGHDVHHLDDVEAVLEGIAPGSTCAVQVVREGEVGQQSCPVTLR